MLRRSTADDRADRLIDAGRAAADAPGRASADPLAGLVDALRGPAHPNELDGTDDLVARLAATVRRGRAVAEATPTGRHRPVLSKVLTGKVAALAVVTLCSAAAAAATGHLPDPLQRRLSDTLSHVGVDLPSPDDEPAATDPDRLDPPASTPVPDTTASRAVAPGSVATGSVAPGSSAPPDATAASGSRASTPDTDAPGAAPSGVGGAPTVPTGSARSSAPGHEGSNPSSVPGRSGEAGDDHHDDQSGRGSGDRAHDRSGPRGGVTSTTAAATARRRRRAGDETEPTVPSATTAHGRP